MAAQRRVFDYIIVGAGSAGSVLAKRLSANPNKRVLLLEAGASDLLYLPIHVPVGYLYCIDNPRTDWRYKTERQPGLQGRALSYPRGKGLGGCSSINGMIYMRGQREDYDGWAKETGDKGWSWDALQPLFKKDEDYHGAGTSEHRGKGGSWTVSKQRLKWQALEVFKAATIEMGIPATEDFNTGNNFGVSYFDVSQKGGWRLNAFQAFVRPLLASRPNLQVKCNAHTTRLNFASDDSTKCRGLSFIDGSSGGQEVHAWLEEEQGEVILAAGSVGSVQILERSGIGCAKRLGSIPGITPRVHLPGVGEDLQDHLQLRISFSVSDLPTLNTRAASIIGKLGIGLEYLYDRSGPLSMAPSQLGVFAHSSPRHTRANVEFHVQPLSLDKFGEPLHTYDAITASVCNLRPTSRGSIHITSADPLAAPCIDPAYLSTEEDRTVAAESIRLARKIVMSSDAFKPHAPQEVVPGAQYQSDAELAEAAGRVGTTIFHPVGTCKMGIGPREAPGSVVSPELRVHGVRGLRVADASVMPSITSGNTAAPAMVIAERAAEMILRGG